MLEFDGSKIRAQVIRDYELLARDITDAEAMNRFFDAVMATAVGSLREMLHEVNQESFLGRIPPEVLAACFAHLPFRYRLHPSQVCRSWRAAALADPSLWSDIQPWSPCNSPELLQMALSRAGARPVDLKVDACDPIAPEAIYTAVAPFSRHLRYLAWLSEQPNPPWEFPAPNMECFWSSRSATLTAAFLGGHAGRLRFLYLDCVQLPAVCPALSTVTELSVALTPYDDAAPSTLGNLFDLFPQLEFLHIRGITRPNAHLLPTGAAPASLVELWLRSRSTDYDLVPHCLAWDSGHLRHISIEQCSGTRPNLERLASGTVRLAVNHTSDEWHTQLMFEHSPTVSHSMTLFRIGISNAAALLAAVQSSLSIVHTVMVSHVALKPLAGVLRTLPKLVHLFLHIIPKAAEEGEAYPNQDPHSFVWTPLSYLSNVTRAMPRLRTITLHVWCGDCSKPAFADANDARRLLSQLLAVQGALPPIVIEGFPAEEVSGVDLTGLNVRFDFSAKVSPLILRKPHEAYDPFEMDESDW
ncbi:hypothetical protein AURDEDRAFT_188517 [Auricularia subglabra TFB-10046 SS5]|uniref:F-box domain-containing protein n=1 Tax=Auricularia subglabra (strain TFB-10046 / SS5) TaxID=717982 RepID=J0WSF7_AURST|nr:hypothetical protein AURDEDRAFT_188517 [Auricularia subglabra TFB-10046 SS5]